MFIARVSPSKGVYKEHGILSNLRRCYGASFRVVGLTELKHVGWNIVELLDRIKNLDNTYLANSEAAGSLGQWLPIFLENPWTWRALVSSNDELVA